MCNCTSCSHVLAAAAASVVVFLAAFQQSMSRAQLLSALHNGYGNMFEGRVGCFRHVHQCMPVGLPELTCVKSGFTRRSVQR
jgi:hypothetical protein